MLLAMIIHVAGCCPEESYDVLDAIADILCTKISFKGNWIFFLNLFDKLIGFFF